MLIIPGMVAHNFNPSPAFEKRICAFEANLVDIVNSGPAGVAKQ